MELTEVFPATFASNSRIISLVHPVSPLHRNLHPAMHTRHLAIFILGLSTPLLGAAEWTRFRGPDGLGTAADKNVPVTFGPNENVLWKVEIPGRGNSSPIVSKGKVLLQTAAKDSSN